MTDQRIACQFSGLILLILSASICAASPTATSPCDAVKANSGADRTRPIVFTPAHQDNAPWWYTRNNGDMASSWKPQSVPLNSCVQIQLPGQPTEWKIKNVQLNEKTVNHNQIKRRIIDNDGRFIMPCIKAGIKATDCPSKIYQFQLNVVKAGVMKMTLTGNPGATLPLALASGNNGFDQFTLTLIVNDK